MAFIGRRASRLVTAIIAILGFTSTVVGQNQCNNTTLSATGSSQYFTSPNYPSDYSSDLNCQWSITAVSSSQVVVLKLLDFFLEGSPSICNYDNVDIYDGSITSTSIAHSLCGEVKAAQFISTNNLMTVVFHTDGAVNYRGFKFEYTSLEKSALCCNDTLAATKSPNYLRMRNCPTNYTSNCQWTINAASSLQVITLRLLTLEMKSSSTSCDLDYLIIYDGYSTSSPTINTFCGQSSILPFISTGPALTVVFHSNELVNLAGFRLEYTSQTKSALCENFTMPSNVTSNYVTSPGYPYGYTSNLDCMWHRTSDSPSQVIVLDMLDFYLEGDSSLCSNDYVTIYDGDATSSTIIQKLCGQVSSMQVASSGMHMTVVFHSNSQTNYRGFQFYTHSESKSAQCYSGTVLASGSLNYLTTPNYPYNYASNKTCHWTINAASSSEVVVLKVLTFELEDSSPSCDKDYVAIYDGFSPSYTTLQNMCGHVSSSLFISTGTSMTVVFHSNDLINLAGFKFEYTSQTKSALCENFTMWSNGTSKYITSPGYPYSYTSNLDCTWHLSADSPSQVVVLDMLDLYLEANPPYCYYDYMTVYEGNTTSSPIIQTLCGEVSRTQVASSGMYMTVVFHSDSSTNYKGIKFDYTSQNKSDICTSGAIFLASVTPDYLLSPNYPNNYLSNKTCQWTINAASSSEVVVLKFLAFNLEDSSPSCNNDYVAIYDGSSTSFPTINKLCGQGSSLPFISTGPAMTVVFHSNELVNLAGFRLEYTSWTKSALCENFTMWSNGTLKYITSPGYPYSYARYELKHINAFKHKWYSNLDCTWHLSADSPSQVVVLDLLDFYLEPYPPNCYADYLIVYDGNTTSSPMIQTLCGEISNTQVASSGMHMTVVFHSNYGFYYRGFKLVYTWQNKSGLCYNGIIILATGRPDYLVSPNYPNNYLSNKTCQWTLNAAPPADVVVLKVLAFELEDSSPSCNNDYVAIYDGSSTSSPTINKLCGQGSSLPFISTGPAMTVVFHSNELVNLAGFRLEYTSWTKSALCENFTMWSNGTSKYITSPGYPYGYTSYLDCTWHLSTDSPSQVVVLDVLDLYLHDYPQYCGYDYVTIYDGNTTSSPIIQKLCGQVSSTQVSSSGMYMTVVFHSSYTQGQYRGFKLDYTWQNKSDICNSGTIVLAYGSPGYIVSPNYPNNYTSNKTCQWTINAASSPEVVVLKVLTFELEDSSPSCDKDYGAIYDGSSTSSPTINKLCGQGSSLPFISTGPAMTVVFHSNELVNMAGFRLEYTSWTKSALCTNFTMLHNGTSKYITSPGYPYSYTIYLDCLWTMTADSPSQVVVLNLLDFLLEEYTQYCYSDYVTVYDGNTTSSPIIQKLCGQVSSKQIASSGMHMTVVFRSFTLAKYRGFKFEYISQNKSDICSNGTIMLASITPDYLMSPNYPNNYTSNKNCQWTINAASSSEVVVLKVLTFELEDSSPSCDNDYVAIYDGSSTSSPTINKLCGQASSLPIISTGPAMTVVFYSNELVNMAGFRLEYASWTKSALCEYFTVWTNGTSQYITSPGYPYLYTSGLDCSLAIMALSPSQVVVLRVLDFYLEEGNNQYCYNDYVTFYDGNTTISPIIQTLCGQVSSRQITSSGMYMNVAFYSDGQTNFRGFKFEFTSQNKSAICSDGAVFLASGAPDYLISPNYPNNYTSNMNCQWTINAASSTEVVVLKLLTIDLEGSSPSCDNDYVAIYDGSGTSPSIWNKICGQVSSLPFISTGPAITVVFHSNDLVNMMGFRLEYTSWQKSALCENFTMWSNGTSKYITTPGYPYPYPNNLYCTWHLTADSSSQVVVLDLLDFDLPGDLPWCYNDYMAIYDGNTTSSPMILKLCAQVSSTHIASSGMNMTIDFHSYATLVHTGFKVDYTYQNKSGKEMRLTKPLLNICNSGTILLATKTPDYLTSLNYPNNYESNKTCQWTINAASSPEVVVLKLLTFDLEDSSPSCDNDYVTIYEGSSTSSSTINKLCGQGSSLPFISTGPAMTVVFHSNELVNLAGFRLEYTSQTKSALCENFTMWSNGTSKYITSPGYPYNYTSNLNCLWHLTADSASQVVVLNVLDFYLDGYPQNYHYDYVTIYDGETDESPVIQYMCCQVSSGRFASSDMYMTVVFRSVYSTTYRGFKFEYTSQNKSAQCTSANLIMATESPDYIVSPSYPNNYTSNKDCQWIINTSASEVIALKVLTFELEDSSPSCDNDYVAIYDGSNTSSLTITKLCGQASSLPFISTGPTMTVVFHSNEMGNLAGFRLEYTSQTKSALCENFTKWSNGTSNYITSPGYPYSYTSYLDCTWHITADSHSQVVALNLMDFYLGKDATWCYYVFVTIYDGDTTSSPIIQTLCGQVPSTQVASSGMHMTVVFHSYSLANFRGFKFDYTFLNKSAVCNNGTIMLASGTPDYLMSPNYSSNYSSNKTCTWIITAASASDVVLLKLLAFELEDFSQSCDNDYVAIYDGYATSSTKVHKLCGQVSVTQFESTGIYMSVVFHSNGNYNSKGFLLEYTSQNKSAPCTDVILSASATVNFLSSANYPGQYPSNMDCQWHIKAGSDSSVIVLKLSDFSLEGSQPMCTSDYIKIYDGPSTSSSLLITSCGSESYSALNSTSSYMTVVFHSDGRSSNNTGFRFTYQSQDKNQQSTDNQSSNDNSTAIGVGVGVGLGILFLCVIAGIVIWKIRKQKHQRNSPSSDSSPNVRSNPVSAVGTEADNPGAPPPYLEMQGSQSTSNLPGYSDTNLDGNRDLPPYTPSDPSHTFNYLDHKEFPGWPARQESTPTNSDLRPDRSRLFGEHNFAYNHEGTRDDVTDNNVPTDANATSVKVMPPE